MLKEILEQHAIWQKINNEECPNLEDANLEGITPRILGKFIYSHSIL